MRKLNKRINKSKPLRIQELKKNQYNLELERILDNILFQLEDKDILKSLRASVQTSNFWDNCVDFMTAFLSRFSALAWPLQDNSEFFEKEMILIIQILQILEPFISIELDYNIEKNFVNAENNFWKNLNLYINSIEEFFIEKGFMKNFDSFEHNPDKKEIIFKKMKDTLRGLLKVNVLKIKENNKIEQLIKKNYLLKEEDEYRIINEESRKILKDTRGKL